MIGNKLEPFKFWCQKVLPNVYDDSLSYYEYLCKLNEYLNEVIEQINTLTDNMEDYETDLTAQWREYKTDLNTEWTDYKAQLTEQWTYYKNYIDHYFDNLDVQTEINNKLDQMALNGTLSALIEPFVGTDIQNTVNAWLTEHVDPVGSAVIVDNTLSISGAAADSKITGNNVFDSKTILDNIITNSGVDLCTMYRPTFSMGGVTFTYSNDGKPIYHLSGTATQGIVTTLALTNNNSNYRYYVNNLKNGTKIKISGGLNEHVRVAIQAFDSNEQSLGYTQDSGTGATYTKTSDADYIIFIIIVDNATVVNNDIMPSFRIEDNTLIGNIENKLNTLIDENIVTNEKLVNTVFTTGSNIWNRMTNDLTTNGVTFTKILKNGKIGYNLSGTSTGGIIFNIGGYVYNVDNANIDVSFLSDNSKILISGGLNSEIRVGIEAFDLSDTSLGFTQDSGYGVEFIKTSSVDHIRVYIIVNNNVATNVDVFPSFVLIDSTLINITKEVYLNKTDTYRNICNITTGTKTMSGVTFTKTSINGNVAYKLSGTSTSPIFCYLTDNYVKNEFVNGTKITVSGSHNSAIRVALEYKDSNFENTVYKQDGGNTGFTFEIENGMYYYKPLIIVNNNTNCDDVLIVPKFILTNSLQNVNNVSDLKIMTFGDSIIADDFAGIGTKIAEVGNLKLVKNWAHGGASASDWYLNNTDISDIELDFNDMYTGGKNVLANQVRAALQYTTKENEQITWEHPIDGWFNIDTTYGTGLGHTNEKPDIIFISCCTNDGHTTQGGERTTSVVDDVSTVISESYSQLDRSSIASGIRWAVETLQCAYPNAIIFVNSPFQTGYEAQTSDSYAFSYNSGDTKREIIEKISRFCSTHYIDSFSESGYSFMVAQNGGALHPNGINRYNIARFLLNEINNRYTERKKWF